METLWGEAFRYIKGGYRQPTGSVYNISKKFVPKTDITTYEVAYILAHCHGTFYPSHEVKFTQEKWDNLEPQYKRHFEDKIAS